MSDMLLLYSNDLIEEYIIKDLTERYKIIDVPDFKLKNINRIVSRLFFIYCYLYIRIKNPKICITSIDNSGFFQKLITIFPDVNFFAIQNGNRTKKELLWPHKNKLSNYLCFGKYEKYTFKEFGHYASNYIPVGSLTASIYKSKKSVKDNQIKYDICFVSQWRDPLFFEVNKQLSIEKNYMKKIDGYLKKLVDNTNNTVCIAMRSGKNSLEYKYYQKLFNGKVFLQPKIKFSTYELMDNSELVTTFFSTAATEAFGWGKKVLFIDYSETCQYAYYKQGIWLLKDDGYDNFEERLNMLINISQDEFNQQARTYSNYVMNYDSDEPSYVKIQNELKSFL